MIRRSHRLRLLVVWAFAAVLCTAPSARAQVFTGRIDVTTQDQSGAVLPGVTVELTGPQNQTATTDAQGQAHFLNLQAGTYLTTSTCSRRCR